MATNPPTAVTNPPNPQVPGAAPTPAPGRSAPTPVTNPPNPQVPAAAPVPPPGRPIQPLTDNGGGFNRQIGDVRADGAVLTQFLSGGTPVWVIRPAATPTAVTPASNPQVRDDTDELIAREARTIDTTTNAVSPFQSTVSNFNEAAFAQNNPKEYAQYVVRRGRAEEALTNKYYILGTDQILQSGGSLILPGGVPNPANAQIEAAARVTAKAEAVEVANQEFSRQIAAAGAGTLVPAANPLLPTSPSPPTSPSNTAPVSPAVNPQVPGNYPGTVQNPAQLTPPGVAVDVPEPVDPVINPQVAPVSYDSFGNPVPVGSPAARSADISAAQAAADQTAAGANNANLQGQIQAQSNQDNAGDWRVKLRLAPSANYLYKAKDPGILQALSVTNGVIFPYTPKITTSYTATYNPYDLTHSNVRGYFYQGSHVGEVKLTAIFTAQDTTEANYLLAVIHFFRSVTKMFYGQDQQYRGSPPPLVFLQGLGEYQFSNHPCVVSQFDYTLPDDVDYIRARSVTVSGANLLQRRARSNNGFGAESTSADRLDAAGLSAGGLYIPPAPPTLGTNSPTYVPTKMEIAITLLPIQTRAQVSQQFSLEKFGNGNLQKGGFW